MKPDILYYPEFFTEPYFNTLRNEIEWEEGWEVIYNSEWNIEYEKSGQHPRDFRN